MYRLYYYSDNASLAPHFLLHEMQLDYELVLVDRKADEQKSPAYLTLNPTGRIPTLVDGDFVLFESAAICLYLCEKNPEHALIPASATQGRAHFYQWLAFLNNTLQAELMVYYYPQRHTVDANATSNIVAMQEIQIAQALDVLDKQLAGKAFLLGNQISACDFYLFMLAGWSLKIARSPLSFPALSAYLRRLAQRQSIIEVCKKEGISLKIFE